MKLSKIKASLIISMGGGVFSASVAAQAASANPDSFEFKVMLDSAPFNSSDRETGIDNF